MAKGNSDQIKTSIYLSHNVWGELKLHAFHERTTASDVINYVVEQYLKERSAELQLSIHRSHNRDEDRKGRSVYFTPDIWDQLQELAKTENFSIASLIENLLSIYLGLAPEVKQEYHIEERDPLRYVRVGGKTFDLGENPIIIDENGQPLLDQPSTNASDFKYPRGKRSKKRD